MISAIRYAHGGFLRSQAFTLVAVLSLGLGIRGNAAIFSLVNAILLRMLRVPEQNVQPANFL
jgi:hypothetical protein